MTLLTLSALERIALVHASAESPLKEALRAEIEKGGPIKNLDMLAVYDLMYKPGVHPEGPFLRALLCYFSARPDRRKRSRRSTDLDAERQSIALMAALGEQVGTIYGEAVGEAFDESRTAALNRKIAAHEPRAGEGRTDGN